MRYKNELIDALLKEIEIVATSFGDKSSDIIETIYIGGGTPSLLSKEEINSILEKTSTRFTITPSPEITLEVNPDDITALRVKEWKETGINRLSIGVQSFFDEDLKWMNRAHSAEQAIGSLQLVKQYFDNITIDLIYGTPGLTNEKWKQNVEKAIAFNIPHLSCYALTVESKTLLQKLIQQHKSENIDPDKQSEQFLLLMQWLEEAGYEHYEISNFAKPGYRSRHNSSYWQGKSYYGLGPSAHSFDGNARWWNIANNNIYIESINKGIIPFEKEELTTTQKINEYIMTSLRTTEGLHLEIVENILGVNRQLAIGNKQTEVKPIIDKILNQSRKYIERGQVVLQDKNLVLTKEGKLLADGIAADLFVD